MQPDLDHRLDRLYAAVGQTVERRPERLGVEVTSRPGVTRISFRAGQTDAQLENAALQAVFHVAHLRDHFKKWLKGRGSDPALVEATVQRSQPLKTLIDLADADKHGLSRNGGLTGAGPKLVAVNRVLRLTGRAEAPMLEISLTAGGVQSAGDTAVVITGDVVTRHGEPMYELQELLQAGVEAWEQFLESNRSGGAA